MFLSEDTSRARHSTDALQTFVAQRSELKSELATVGGRAAKAPFLANLRRRKGRSSCGGHVGRRVRDRQQEVQGAPGRQEPHHSGQTQIQLCQGPRTLSASLPEIKNVCRKFQKMQAKN